MEIEEFELKMIAVEEIVGEGEVDCEVVLLNTVEFKFPAPALTSFCPVVPPSCILVTSVPMTVPVAARANKTKSHQVALFLHFLFFAEAPIKYSSKSGSW